MGQLFSIPILYKLTPQISIQKRTDFKISAFLPVFSFLLQLPQLDRYISQMLTYSQDFKPLVRTVTDDWNECRSFWLH
ncbi:hypothetical protein ACFFH4_26335, partial [Halalkalibacter alkalisediminis]